jgi:Methane oxygenase PmoA
MPLIGGTRLQPRCGTRLQPGLAVLATVLTLAAGGTRLQPRPANAQPFRVDAPCGSASATFTLRHEGPALVVRDGAHAVLHYNYGLKLAAGVAEDRRRASYIHPLFGPDGEVLTDDFPKDHYHHRGLYWAWPDVWLGDQRVDQWHLKGVWTQFDEWLAQDVRPCSAVIGIRNGWYDATRRRVADEVAWLRIGPFDGVGRTLDIDLTFTATAVPITIRGQLEDKEKGYGGLQYRPAPGKDNLIATDTVPEITRKDTDKVPSKWADYSAMFGDRTTRSGVAIFPSSDHPGFPPGWTTRYYGFLGVAWPALEKVTVSPGGPPLHLRYRIYVHRGGWEEGKVREAYRAWTTDSTDASR